jgi:plastocyanin
MPGICRPNSAREAADVLTRSAALALALWACAPAASAATHTVVVEGMQFQPSTLTVKRGDRVVWVNHDVVPHTATAVGRTFGSPAIAPGASWATTVNKAGQHDYVCTLHPTMKASLAVK